MQSIQAYLGVNRLADALADGDRLLRDATASYGADHYAIAEARAYRAMAVQRSNRGDEARKEFERAVAVLIDPSRVASRQQASVSRATRLRQILNEYLAVLAGSKGTGQEKDIAEALRIADVARWQSVQKAVTGSALRAAAGSPELGARIKKAQDADDELEAVYKNLDGALHFHFSPQTPAWIAGMVRRLRSSVDLSVASGPEQMRFAMEAA